VRVTFDDEDEDAYFATRETLLDEIVDSLSPPRNGAPDPEEVAGAVGVLLDWRWNYSTGQLDDWAIGDVDEFLLDWLPRKFSAPPEAGAEMCSAVADFFLHMGARDRLLGGPDHAARLIARAHQLTDDVVAAMGDPANFGMAKSLFTTDLTDAAGNPLADVGALLGAGADPDNPGFQALMQERIDAFNALPFEERKAVTDPAMEVGRVPLSQRIRIPVVDIPPTADELSASIAASRLVTMVQGLVDYVGPKGIALTQAGNLRLADARKLVAGLGTDDRFERRVPGSDETEAVRTSADLVQLTLVFDVAVEAGALELLQTKVKPESDWASVSPADRACEVIDALMAIGPTSSRALSDLYFQLAMIIEDGIPHWLALGLGAGIEVPVDDVVDQAVNVVDSGLHQRPALWKTDEALRDAVSREVSEVLAVLHFAGLIDWQDRGTVNNRYGATSERGGWFRLTPLGRHTMVDHIRDAGYDFPTLEDLTTAEAEDLVNVALAEGGDLGALLPRWRPDDPTLDRAAALAAFAMEAELPEQRLTVMTLLDLLEPVAAVEPAVRQMLDSACAGHATAFLLDHELATLDELGSFFDISPLVDILATTVDDPPVLCDLFLQAVEQAHGDLLEDLWRHDQPETIEILETLGLHLPDKKLAKACRKAAIRHRSWKANQAHPDGR
jgi:hypothetical protein